MAGQECRSYLIKLTGLSTETDEDYLTFHLESKEQVEVQDVKMNEDQTSAIVNLQSQMDVEKILKKNHLEIEGSTITAEAYIPEDSSAIEVKGDPDIINEDNAEMLFWYFSNTSRSGGGNIVECSVQSGVAHFTFETSNVAKQVLEKKNHIFRKHPLDVKLFKPEQTCKHRNTLLVSDIPEGKGIDDDYLVLFFENKNNFGDNVHVTNTEYDEQNGTALVEFRDQTSLDVVLQRQPLSMKSKVIKVNMYPLRTVDGTLSVISTNEEQFEYEVSGRVSQLLKRAQKLPRVKSNIQQFFQQAKNVKAEMTKPSVFDPGIHSNNQSDNCKKVQITNLPDKADKEFILLYFENQLESSKYQLVDVETDTENACAILHFDKPEAAEYIIEKQPFVLKQQQVFAKKYLASKQGTVMVRGIDDMNENIDTLQLYFKNERKSDGGKIAYLHVDEETNCAYITFENEQVAKRVVQRKRHVLRSKELEVVLVSSKENKPCVENEKDKRYHKIPENNNVEKLQVEQELERKVWLSNVPAGTDKDFLKWYFEDQFDGVKIKKVEIYCDISCAFVEVFKVSEAKIILREKAVKMKNTEVSINKYSSICTIEVIGSTNTELEMEKMLCYFKNEKQSGGGAVVKHSTDDSKTAAYFMFETHKVADRVVNHDHREFEITVSVLGKNIENCMPIETIKVKGITQEITKQDLQLYFETYERSGGGEIECITYITTDNSVALVKFRKAEGFLFITLAKNAKVVTKRRKHVIENCTLTAVLHHPPPFYETKVLLKGLVHTSPSFDLLDFFESNMGSRPKSVTYHLTEDNTALVTMEKNIDFEKLQKACDKERSLGITRVTQSTCILISKLGNDVSTDEIKYYFEKKCGHRTRRVEKMVPERSNGTCLIYFESYQDLSNIVEDTHTIDGKTFNVEYFQTEINRAEVDFCQRPFLSPKPIEIKDDIDLSKIQYIQSSEKYKKDLEDKLCKQYVNIIWPSQGQKKLELHCTLTKTVENHHGLAKFWRKETERAFSDFLEAISVRIIELQEDVQEDIMAFLKEFTVKEPSKVALICNRNKMNLHVVGEKYDVHMLEQTIISEMKEQKSFELVMNIEHQIEMNVLVTTNIKSMFESEFENINVKLVREENKIVLHGRKSSVRNAADRLKEIRGNLKRTYIEHLEEPFTELYMSENVMRFIQERLSAKDIIASWTVRNGMLEICCNGPHKISECKEIIQNSVIRKMKVVPSPVPNLHSDKWRRTVEDLHSKYKGKIRIKLAGNATKIYIYATEDLERPASEDVTHFLETNKVIIKTYKTFQLQMRFFKKHLKSAIEEISKQFDVRIEIDHKNFYRIQGLQVDVNEAATNIKDMFDKCWQTKETFEMIGIKLYIGRMKDSINLVENKCQCVIGTEDDLPLHCVDNNDTKELSMRTEESRSDRIGSFESSLFAQEKISRSMDTSICYKNRNSYKQQIVNGAKIFAKCLVFENIHIIVCHGDITNLKVDVIARETDDNLDFSGTLGRTIIQKGGQAVKDECLRLVQTQKLSLQNTSTVFSSAGSMKAKFICHIRIQKWSQAGEKHLESSVLQCISQSSERQANSLAFPALGCGMNGFPAHVSASVIVRTIKRSFQETQNSSVTEIYFCDVRKENVQNFTKALCEEFGKRNVDVEDGDSGMDFTDYTTSLNEELRTVKLPNIQASQGPFVREIKFGGICVCVKGGTIVNEKVDVLVNTTSNSLNLKGGAVSTSVLQKGGLELQQQLHKTYPKGIKFGEVAVSDGTNLPCSIVLHTALEKWDDKNFGKCIKDLQKTVRECMEITEKRQLSSIAFPAIGTGTLGYPHEVVAAEMLSAIEKVSVKSHKVNDVRFIMFQTDHKAAQAFEDELKKRHGTCSKTDVFEKRRRPWFLRNFRLGKQMEQSNDAAISVKQTEQSNNVGQVQVTLVKGEISEQKVNVIVNTVANSLDLSCGSVSSALLKAAGPDLQGELNTKYANGIQSGEIAISSGKGLKCDHVFHCTLANWNAADTNTSKHVLRSAITTCMHEAEKLRHSSMALPAIGTGNLGFPCDVVATEMFNAVSTFPAMCLKDIRVVIFPTHTQTVQAFEEEFLKWTSQIDFGNVFGANDTQLEHTLALASPSPALHAISEKDHKSSALKSSGMDSVACKAVYYTVGNVRVTVKQGDITKEDTDAIVNSSNKDLDMSQGGVAQAIRKAGGQELDTELKRLRQTMKNEQIVVSEAKGLGCKNIIHITAVEMSTVNYIDKWNSVIIRCLQEADKCLFTSIALPALGTGLGMTAAASADMIMKAIVEYQGNIQHHVTDIRVVVYQSSMTEEYQKAAKYATCRNKLTDSDGSVPGNVVDKTQRSVILGAETSALQLKEDVVDPDKVTLAIIALHPGDIDRITRKLTKRFKEKQKVKKIKEDIIKKMHGKQMEEINDIAKRYHLHFEAETAKGKIKISGYHEHVSEALEEIQRVINAAKMDQHSTTYVELLKKPVQWYFVENGEMKEFDKETNLYIEAARTNQKLQFIFRHRQCSCVLDFGKEILYREDKPDDTVSVIRKELQDAHSFKPPATWDSMKENQNLLLVDLLPATKEYQDLQQTFTQSIHQPSSIQQPSSCDIVGIKRIQNRSLMKQYEAKKTELEVQNPNMKNENFLWHGTSPDAVESINNRGFNRSYCGKNATAFGKGVYFAVNASYSAQNTYSPADSNDVKRIYYCRVLTGDYTEGKTEMKVLPQKSNSSNSSILYDSAVDKKNSPSIYVVFHDTQAYPEYLVSFKIKTLDKKV